MLSGELTYLNHGSFGARPRPVHEHQEQLRASLEASPVRVLDEDMILQMPEIKSSLGSFLGMEPAGIGLVQNASEAICSVLRSIQFEPGDEIICTRHGYNAVLQLLRYVSSRHGVTLHVVDIDLPVTCPDSALEHVLSLLGDSTRLVVIDQITSPTALVLDVENLLCECRNRAIDTLVDGAHGPGMIDLDISSMGATWYAGNLHKWTCAPIGAGFLWTDASRLDQTHPVIISHGYEEGYAQEFDWQGTRDMTSWRSIPFVLDWVEKTWGWDAVRTHNHQLATWAHEMLTSALGVEPLSPLDGAMLGSMATVRLPAGIQERLGDPLVLQKMLRHEYRIEVPVMELGEEWFIRVSSQVYNRPRDYEDLAQTLLAIA